jgi:hypothetical protein
VTAEFAIVLPAVVAVLAVSLLVASAAIAQVRCTDAARAAARAAAIGAAEGEVAAVARTLAGSGAAVTVRREGEWVVVRIERDAGRAPWVAGPFVAAAEARAWVEPGEGTVFGQDEVLARAAGGMAGDGADE